MLIFIFIVLSYSTANYYLFSKLSAILDSGPPVNALVAVIIIFMALAPVFIPIYSHRGSEKAVTLYSYAGYLWLAFLVPFFSAGVVLDVYNFAVHYAVPLAGKGSLPLLSPEAAFFVPLLLSLAVNAYGYYEAGNIRIERLVIHTAKLPKGTGKIRVAQISDLHLGVIVGEKTLEKVIMKIQNETPDIIVSTGDLLDGIVRHSHHLSKMLEHLQARLGKFAVMGNHEVYGGIKGTIPFIRDSGFTLLRGEGVTVDNSINIAGMDFIGGEARSYSKSARIGKEDEVLARLPSDLFTILLKHRPDVNPESPGLFDLQLSGHTHKGQIFPVSLATMFLFRHHTGFKKLPKGSSIYVSRGTGTAGPPVRFLSTPEITIIDIVSESESS